MGRAEDIYQRVMNDGVNALEAFINDRQSEELFLDFKRSSNDGNDVRFSTVDRKNLSKAISGFGNSEGGVIVWGVNCSPDSDGADVASMLVPLENPKRFASLIQGAISGCTLPPHSGVQNEVIEIDNNKGYVITLVPKSNSAPHQCIVSKHYYIRAGSSFVPTPHDVLAGMFGRRPQPHIFPHFILGVPKFENDVLKLSFGIAIHNEGPGIASDIFSICRFDSIPSAGNAYSIETPDRTNWTGMCEFDSKISLISVAGYRLPPLANVQPLIVHLGLKPPFDSELKIFVSAGCGQSRRYDFIINQTAQVIAEQYERLKNMNAMGHFSREEMQAVAEVILNRHE